MAQKLAPAKKNIYLPYLPLFASLHCGLWGPRVQESGASGVRGRRKLRWCLSKKLTAGHFLRALQGNVYPDLTRRFENTAFSLFFIVILILLFINMSFDTSKQQELTGLAIGEPPFCDLIWSRIFYLRLHLMIFDRACHCPPLPPSPTRPHPVIRGHRLRIMGKPTVPRSSYD